MCVDDNRSSTYCFEISLSGLFINPLGFGACLDQGVGKIAKKLGIDYAEAVVGFEFRSRRCLPITQGIVVPEECADVLLEAFHEYSQHANKVANEKHQKEVLGRWRKLVLAVMVRNRLREEYAVEEEELIDVNEYDNEDYETVQQMSPRQLKAYKEVSVPFTMDRMPRGVAKSHEDEDEDEEVAMDWARMVSFVDALS